MIKQIKRLLFAREFMKWEAYKEKIDFLEDYRFQQQTRKQSIINDWCVGEE